jgi:hypothetical protein
MNAHQKALGVLRGGFAMQKHVACVAKSFQGRDWTLHYVRRPEVAHGQTIQMFSSFVWTFPFGFRNVSQMIDFEWNWTCVIPYAPGPSVTQPQIETSSPKIFAI